MTLWHLVGDLNLYHMYVKIVLHCFFHGVDDAKQEGSLSSNNNGFNYQLHLSAEEWQRMHFFLVE